MGVEAFARRAINLKRHATLRARRRKFCANRSLSQFGQDSVNKTTRRCGEHGLWWLTWNRRQQPRMGPAPRRAQADRLRRPHVRASLAPSSGRWPRVRQSDVRDPSSQCLRVRLQIPAHRRPYTSLAGDVDFSRQQLFECEHELGVGQEADGWVERHQQVQVAVSSIGAARDGADPGRSRAAVASHVEAQLADFSNCRSARAACPKQSRARSTSARVLMKGAAP